MDNFEHNLDFMVLNPVLDNKILPLSKLKACADDNSSVAQMMQFLIVKVKPLWEKEKMLVTSIFLFPECFQEAFSSVVLKAFIVW